MSAIEVEVFREDVDELTEALMDVIQRYTEQLSALDRSVIVSAAMANAACLVDGAFVGDDGKVLGDADGVTGRIERCTRNVWKFR